MNWILGNGLFKEYQLLWSQADERSTNFSNGVKSLKECFGKPCRVSFFALAQQQYIEAQTQLGKTVARRLDLVLSQCTCVGFVKVLIIESCGGSRVLSRKRTCFLVSSLV